MEYVLTVNYEWMDTSIGKYDGSTVELIKEDEGFLIAKHSKSNSNSGKPAEIILKKHCDIKTKSGSLFFNVPSSWLIAMPKENN